MKNNTLKATPPIKIFLQDDTLRQLTDKQATFQTLWIKTIILLQDKTINRSQAEKGQLQKELNKLSLQFYYLGSDVRIY